MNQTFGQKLTALRLAKNLTQEELATVLNKKFRNLKATRDQIARWETDKNFPRHQAYFALMGFFNVTYEQLMQPRKAAKALRRVA
jgi:transcriptional regulator with XRE-family HTH domain